tara:strand:- start:814 stop:2280 length:1467 start_codon:yes stop_codon:yes gene_type:complete
MEKVSSPMKTTGFFKSIEDRKLSLDTCKQYGVTIAKNPFRHIYPYYDDQGKLVANKIRNVATKSFHSEGNIKSSLLFGQNMFSNGGKYVTVCEGEVDAMSAYQMMSSKTQKWPVVSIKNGAASAKTDVSNKHVYDFLMSFDNIIICFDNDDAGKAGAIKLAETLAPKAKIMPLQAKDANEYLSLGKDADFVRDWWNAKQYTPENIISGEELWDVMNEKAIEAEVHYPYEGLEKLTHGIRMGELITITAGSGLGKSQFVREILYHCLKNTEHKMGLMFLEESIKRSGLGVMSLAANKPLHISDVFNSTPLEERKAAFDETLGTGRVFLYDHFGSNSIDAILHCVRFFANALNCKFVVLDHVSIVISDQQQGDERRAIDEIMTKLRMIVQELDISLILVSHLKRPSSAGHEEGAVTSLSQLRGSASIGQLSDIVLGLERNGQHEDEEERHTTTVRVIKNRFSGLTGPACKLLYSSETGRMTEKEDFKDIE